jgi:hypothetical protein
VCDAGQERFEAKEIIKAKKKKPEKKKGVRKVYSM